MLIRCDSDSDNMSMANRKADPDAVYCKVCMCWQISQEEAVFLGKVPASSMPEQDVRSRGVYMTSRLSPALKWFIADPQN